jgi:S1-C subfamily serine protease
MGLRVGDQIQFLNGQKIRTRNQVESIIASLRMGDLVTASVIDRQQRNKQINHRTSAKDKPSMHDRWGGGPFSTRRFGFGLTLVHDSVLNPENCGGPLVGLKGQLLGVNIARSMRVASLAIGSDDVLRFVKSHQPNAKLRLASLEDPNLKLARISTPSK